jgi:hypothetical protein
MKMDMRESKLIKIIRESIKGLTNEGTVRKWCWSPNSGGGKNGVKCCTRKANYSGRMGVCMDFQSCHKESDCGLDNVSNNKDLDMAKKTPCPPGQQMGQYGCESPMPNKKSLREQSSGTITHGMIQQCKHLLNNIQGTNAGWKQNFKSSVMGKPCSWIRNRMAHFGGKTMNAVQGSGAQARFKAKTHFLECLLNACQS